MTDYMLCRQVDGLPTAIFEIQTAPQMYLDLGDSKGFTARCEELTSYQSKNGKSTCRSFDLLHGTSTDPFLEDFGLARAVKGMQRQGMRTGDSILGWDSHTG